MALIHDIDNLICDVGDYKRKLDDAQTKLFDAFDAARNGKDDTARDLMEHAKEVIDAVKQEM